MFRQVQRKLLTQTYQHLQSQVRYASKRGPINTVIMFVPQRKSYIIERMGKFNRILEPGLNILIPFIDRVAYVQNLKEVAVEIPQQGAITSDNVPLKIDGVLYAQIIDPYKTSYGVEEPNFAMEQLAQTTMRSEMGKITLDTVFKERELLNVAIVAAINKAATAWGMDCKRYEIRNIELPERVQVAMQMQVEAERKKRAAILYSEGTRTAEINVAEGQKQSIILASEAFKAEQVNRATGEAEAMKIKADAKAEYIMMVAGAIKKENGHNAVSMTVAEQYITAFEKLAKEGNTIILPSNAGDVTSMVAQAMTIYKTLDSTKTGMTASQVNQDSSDLHVQTVDVETVEHSDDITHH